MTKAGYYGRVVSAMGLAGVLCVSFAAWGSMTGGWSVRSSDYQSLLLTIYAYVLLAYIPAYLLMLIRPRVGVIALWCLIGAGGILFCASGFKDGAMMMSAYSVVVPLLGRYVLDLQTRSKASPE